MRVYILEVKLGAEHLRRIPDLRGRWVEEEWLGSLRLADADYYVCISEPLCCYTQK